MTLAARARIEAAPNFLSNLEIAHQFFVEQDADSASERFRKLKAELREMVAVLGWSPVTVGLLNKAALQQARTAVVEMIQGS